MRVRRRSRKSIYNSEHIARNKTRRQSNSSDQRHITDNHQPKTMVFTNKIGQRQAIQILNDSRKEFTGLFRQGKLTVEIYRPHLVDKQSPHDRDEFYLVISGRGKFALLDQEITFEPGDFLYVPAHAPHRFTEFSDDFVTWVFFID
jgi:mannose-6-phosphate isomerase-like protein (cupin superfamily)